MRFFNRNVPDGERDQGQDETNEQASPRIEMTRRGFMAAALSALVVSACDGDKDEKSEPALPEVDTAETFASKYDLNTLRKMLIQKYPELGKISMKTIKNEDGTTTDVEESNPKFRKMGMEDDYQDDLLVQAYFLKVNYENLYEDGVILPNDSVEANDYLNPEKKMWPKKLRKVCENHKKDMEVALANIIAEERKNPPENMDYQKFVDLAGKVVKEVTGKMKELELSNPNKYDLINDYTSLIDADFLVGLSIHEVIPTEYNDLMRIALLRTLFEEGFQINKIPAIHDDVASFGPLQMSVIPYEGRTRDDSFGEESGERTFKEQVKNKKGKMVTTKVKRVVDFIGDIEPYLADFNIPHQLCDCIKLEDQLKAGMLLLLTNFDSLFKKLISENERFKQIWEASSLTERRIFLATILGAAHNNPRNAKLSLDQAIGWDRPQADSADYFLDDVKGTKEVINNLTELRTAYINIAKRCHSISAREGEETSNLIAKFSTYNVNSEEKIVEVLAKVSPKAAVDSAEKPLVKPESADTSIPQKEAQVVLEKRHELKMLKREREGYSYFTFDVPNWKLTMVTEYLCGGSNAGIMEAIKKINKVDHFKPGDPILIPVKFMKAELQDPSLVEVKIPKGKDKKSYLSDILKDGIDPKIAVLYNPTKPAATDLSDLGDVIRVPKALLK